MCRVVRCMTSSVFKQLKSLIEAINIIQSYSRMCTFKLYELHSDYNDVSDV